MQFRIGRADGKDPLTQEVLRIMIRESFERASYEGDYVGHYQSGMWWIAQCEGEPAGFALMTPSSQWDKVGYLALAGVSPAYRGHRLQRRLIRIRERAARRLGWRTLVTEVIDNNPHSMRNLFREGFLPYVPAKPWGHKNAIYMRKKLA